MPDDLGPLPYCDATLEPLVKWTELDAGEVIRRADALYLPPGGAGPTIGNCSLAGLSRNHFVTK
jgi:hypothetical protein